MSAKDKLDNHTELLDNNDIMSELNIEIEKFVTALKECRKSTKEIIGEFNGILNS